MGVFFPNCKSLIHGTATSGDPFSCLRFGGFATFGITIELTAS